MLTKQQRATLIKKPVTSRHESVEIIMRAKRCLFESLLLLSAREVLDDVPTSSAHAIHDFHGFPEPNEYRSLTRLSPGV